MSKLYKGKIQTCFENGRLCQDVVKLIIPSELRDCFSRVNRLFATEGRLMFSGNNFFPFRDGDEKSRKQHINLCNKLATYNLHKIDFIFGEAGAYVEAGMIESGRGAVPLTVVSIAKDMKSEDLIIKLSASAMWIDPCRLEKELSVACFFSLLSNNIIRVYYRSVPYIGPDGYECSPCHAD